MSDLTLAVWREACGRLDVEQSADRIARLLAGRVPADGLVLRRLDPSQQRIETVAIGVCRREPALGGAKTICTAEEFGNVLEWCRGGRSVRGRATADSLLRVLAPGGGDIDWLAGPLARDGEPIGVLLLAAATGQSFRTQDEHLLLSLLEPLGIALANSSAYHELARHHEAMEADNRALLSRLDRDTLSDAVVGSEAGLRHVMERVTQVAPTGAPVLIVGETGTGKEVLARTIHSKSQRASGPIVRVNCGAIPPGLIDSELFGHERGSFTGAINVRRGWFERADGGTLFLDEIGELPLDAQVRLLRILQDGTFERVGGHKSLVVDVRIVAATHRNLQEMVAARTFREDLWYRISVFPIHLPPLRDRTEDIPMLAAHFAWRSGRRLGGNPLSPSPADIELLAAYQWPGNVRELASVIERAAILGNGRELKVAAALGTPVSATPSVERDVSIPAPSSAAVSLDAHMIQHIEEALAATGGRIEGPYGAAKRLHINPHTLRARMRKLGIDWRRFRSASRG
jgi:transcriptional regulator with GAF, ATPase, and Fis domain